MKITYKSKNPFFPGTEIPHSKTGMKDILLSKFFQYLLKRCMVYLFYGDILVFSVHYLLAFLMDSIVARRS